MATSGCRERDGPRCRARWGRSHGCFLHRRVRLKRDGAHDLTEDTLAQAVSAARDGDVDALSAVLARSPEVISMIDANGRTLLDLACRAATGDIAIPLDPGTPGQHAAVDLILQAGADPSAADRNGWTPLHTAGMAGHSDLARRLLEAGASPKTEAFAKSGGVAPVLRSVLRQALHGRGSHTALSRQPPHRLWARERSRPVHKTATNWHPMRTLASTSTPRSSFRPGTAPSSAKRYWTRH